MRVQVVDPSAYTPPYDHALCHALAAAGVEVELVTSRFAYGPVAAPDGYARRELFYRIALGSPGGRVRMAGKLAQHVPDMLRYRRHAREADVAHFQWLPVQYLDAHLLPPARSRTGGVWSGRAVHRPALVLTAHDVLPREPRPGQLAAQRRLYGRFDAIVVHSEHGRARLVEELGVEGERVHVIPHGVFTHLASAEPGDVRALSDGPQGSARAAPEGAGAVSRKTASPRARGGHGLAGSPSHDHPVVLMFGLMRPYKGIDVLLDAWRGVERRGGAGESVEREAPIEDAELWIVGMPRMDLTALDAAHGGVQAIGDRWNLRSAGSRAGHAARNLLVPRRGTSLPCLAQHRQDTLGRIRFEPRFVGDDELPAYFERADLVVLPYLQADQSGVLFTALAFGKPLLLSDVGGFPELASTGAARIVPAGDARALGRALRELLGDRATLAEMCVRARAAATGRYSWEAIARAHVELYTRLLQEAPRR